MPDGTGERRLAAISHPRGFALPALFERPSTNVLEVTVVELAGALKRTIEDRFGMVRVRGEISNYRGPHSSGHAYFCLKDDTARIDAVIWKTAFARLKTKPQEGLEVIATGRVSTFPGKSTYQIVIESLEPAGLGALMALLEQRRTALAAEGLFETARKRPIPFLPKTIGVVTSPTGSVIRDILHRIADRFPRDVVVWPVRVQGETAAVEIAAAITGFNALPFDTTIKGPRRPEVIIVARGGGSLEDLWAFNEEIVVRAAAASEIPVIAAVGHETDTTLIDHVADLRAPTPSGAAEKAVPVRSDLRLALAEVSRRRGGAIMRLNERRRADLRALSRGLPLAESVTSPCHQRLDRAEGRLVTFVGGAQGRRHLDLSRLAHRLSQQAPQTRLAQRRQAVAKLEQRLRFVLERTCERRVLQLAQSAQRLASLEMSLARDLRRARLARDQRASALLRAWTMALDRRRASADGLGKLLETLGYRQVLSRGFALVRDSNGRPLRSARAVPPTSFLDIEFVDGHIDVVMTGAARPRRSRIKSTVDQGYLF